MQPLITAAQMSLQGLRQMVVLVDRVHKMSTARTILLGQPTMEKELQSVALSAETQGTGYDLSLNVVLYFARALLFSLWQTLSYDVRL